LLLLSCVTSGFEEKRALEWGAKRESWDGFPRETVCYSTQEGNAIYLAAVPLAAPEVSRHCGKVGVWQLRAGFNGRFGVSPAVPAQKPFSTNLVFFISSLLGQRRMLTSSTLSVSYDRRVGLLTTTSPRAPRRGTCLARRFRKQKSQKPGSCSFVLGPVRISSVVAERPIAWDSGAASSPP
jgi:hypothetical protein